MSELSNKMLRLSTARLDLEAATLAHVSAELESLGRLAAMLQARVGDDWPPGEYDRNAQEMFRDWLQTGGDAVVGWYTWYAIRRGTADAANANDRVNVAIGAGGFLGPPNNAGEVEMGFSILPAWRRQGLATELVLALSQWAFACPQTQKIVAHTTADNLGSRSVLARASFSNAGPAEEPNMIRFERARPL